MKILMVVALCAALGACTTVKPVVIGHCEIPAALDHDDPGVPKIDETKPLTPDQGSVLWKNDRAHLAQLSRHYNTLRDHIHRTCQ